MKRRRWPAILAVLILVSALAGIAQAEQPLPAEIGDLPAGAKILETAHWEGPGSTWFVLIRMPDGINMLLCFELRDGSWTEAFRTCAAVPQGHIGVEQLHITDKVQDYVYNRTWPGPILMILADDGSYTSYQRGDSGVWRLFKVFWYEEQIHLDFDGKSIIFNIPIDHDHSRFETVNGSFERNLEKVDLHRIPRSPQQAREIPDEAEPQSGP